MPKPLEVLKQYWGYDSFRSLQGDVINSILERKDTIALLHTGAGKSLCYQLPALVFSGKTIVVSPLVALMQDQVATLRDRGIDAKAIYAGIGYRQIDLILDSFMNGPLKVLYVSPERLETDIFLERFKKTNISLIAVDEAHCISQWGNDFRPSYTQIKALREWHPDVPIVAVTATATEKVVEDIKEKLELKCTSVFKSTFARENLSFTSMMTEDKESSVLNVLNKIPGSGIIYVRSRRQVQLVAEKLSKSGYSVEYYHGGLPIKTRMRVQQEWIEGKTRIIVCTNAFGMGVDKPDVRFVLHLDIPPSIEEYYQEAGRAGRDGRPSYAVSIIGYQDVVKLQKFHDISYPEIAYLKNVFMLLCSYLKVAHGSGAGEVYDINLEMFSNQYKISPGVLFSCLNIYEKEGLLILNEALKHPSKVVFTSDKSTISMSTRNADLKSKMVLYMLRKFEGVFVDFVMIDEGVMANDLEVKIDQIRRELNVLNRESIISYKPASDQPRITFLKDRPERNSFSIDKTSYTHRKQNAFEKMRAVQELMVSTTCRQVQILRYFGEDSLPCGRCDICKGSKDKKYSQEEKEKLKLHLYKMLDKRKAIRLEEYMDLWPFNKRNKAYAVVNALNDEMLIHIDDHNSISRHKLDTNA